MLCHRLPIILNRVIGPLPAAHPSGHDSGFLLVNESLGATYKTLASRDADQTDQACAEKHQARGLGRRRHWEASAIAATAHEALAAVVGGAAA